MAPEVLCARLCTCVGQPEGLWSRDAHVTSIVELLAQELTGSPSGMVLTRRLPPEHFSCMIVCQQLSKHPGGALKSHGACRWVVILRQTAAHFESGPWQTSTGNQTQSLSASWRHS